jgi:hypothetical protein
MGILKRQALHASELSLPHPDGGNEKTFKSDLPEDIERAIFFLRNLK